MIRYLTRFSDHTSYEENKSSLVPPNVSYCIDEHVHYENVPNEFDITMKYNFLNISNAPIIGFASNIERIQANGAELIKNETGWHDTLEGEPNISLWYLDIMGRRDDNILAYSAPVENFELELNVKLIDNTTLCNIETDGALFGYYLNEITLPSTIKELYSFGETSLSEINIPDSVETIYHETFKYSRNLANVTIGSGIQRIGFHAFECSPDMVVTIKVETPPLLVGVDGVTPVNARDVFLPPLTIRVPSNSVNAYKEVWPEFAEFISSI